MATVIPPFLSGSSAVVASAGLAETVCPGASGPDRYEPVLGPPSVAPTLPSVVPEARIRYERPTLMEIHRAGVGIEPETLLPEFPEVRRLGYGRASGLTLLWREHDESVAYMGFDRRAEEDYLNPEKPLELDEDAAELANLSMNYRGVVIALHHEIRRSLAEEQVFVANLRKNIQYGIRFRLVRGAEPVRDGTVPVNLSRIEDLLERYENFAKPLGREARERLKAGLVRIGAVRGFQERRGWAQPLSIAGVADRLFPQWNDAEKKRAVFFQSVLEGPRSGEVFVPNGSGNLTYWAVFKRAAHILDHPMEEMLRQVLGPAVERWKTKGTLTMDRLKDFLALCNFLAIPEPWRLLRRLHRDEFSWAFAVVALPEVGTCFEVNPETDLNHLREHGFGGLLAAARLERGWNLSELRAAVVRHYGADVSLERLGAITANREQPDFGILRALVEALNGHPHAPHLDLADAFLAAYPTFLGLLPLAARGEGRLIRGPSQGPFEFTAYARPEEEQVLMVTARDVSSDPAGLPALMRRARGMRRLSADGAAVRLGISGATLRRYEEEPGQGERMLPGRLTLSVICHPKGYGLPLDRVLDAHLHSYWSGEPQIALLRERTFRGPIFIEENALLQLRDYAAAPVQTPGELLFFWRNGIPAQGMPFLPSESETAAFLKIPLATYRRWESNAFAPSPKEAKALAGRLGRTEEEGLAFTDACARLRSERLAAVADGGLEHAGLQKFPALSRLAATLALRPFFGEANRRRFYAKMESLQTLDEASMAFLERMATEIGEPDSEKAGRLIAVVHRSEEKARLWPARIGRSGPVAAYAWHQHGVAKAVWDRLARALRNPRVASISFSEDGSCAIEGLSPRGKKPATLTFAPSVAAADVPAVTAVIRRLKAAGRLNNSERTKAFARRVASLAEHDDASFRDFLKAADGEENLTRLCGALENAANFARKWKGTFEWSGSVFLYYFANVGRRAASMYLRARLDRGNVGFVRFDGPRVGFDPVRPASRTVRRGGDARTYSYANATEPQFIPNPKNDWARRDLSLSWSDVRDRITAFFERLEKGLGLSPVEIQRILGRSYYAVRTGADVLGGEYLSDDFLDRLSLDAASKEELRHYQALLLLSRGEEQEREDGPYVEAARVLRYYRLLHQMKLSDVKALYSGGPSIVGPADYELGRMALPDEKRLAGIARGLGVPAPFRKAFAARLKKDYEKADKRRTVSGLRIPHEDWSENDAIEALKKLAVEARGNLTRAGLARVTGLTPSHLYMFENRGEVSADAWPLYRDYLEKDGRTELARRIRVARAVLDLRRRPTETGTGFGEAGALLRFTRFLMIGTSAADAMKRLSLDVDPQLYLRWEWGLNRMPDDVLQSYADLLVRAGALTQKEASGFVSKILGIYRT